MEYIPKIGTIIKIAKNGIIMNDGGPKSSSPKSIKTVNMPIAMIMKIKRNKVPNILADVL